MKKLIIILFNIYFLISYSGCATLFAGGSEEISVTSDPDGAKVSVNGQNEGKTPMTFVAKKGKEYSLEIVNKGYESKTYRLTYSIGAGWIILDILSGLIGIIIDAASGNWNEFDLTNFKANLEPVKKLLILYFKLIIHFRQFIGIQQSVKRFFRSQSKITQIINNNLVIPIYNI